MNTIFNNIFCITCNETRFNYTKFAFSKVGINNLIKVDAVISNTDRVKACKQSHMKAVEHAKMRNLDYCMIIEEDCYPCKTFIEDVNYYMSRVPSNCGVLVLGTNSYRGVQHVSPDFDTYHKDAAGLHCYIVYKKSYDIVLKLWNDINKPCDNIISQVYFPVTIKPYWSHKQLAIQKNIIVLYDYVSTSKNGVYNRYYYPIYDVSKQWITPMVYPPAGYDDVLSDDDDCFVTELIGGVKYYLLKPKSKTIGYIVSSDYSNQGYMTYSSFKWNITWIMGNKPFNCIADKDITVCITSFNRPDLLKITFDSLIKTNTYPIKKYIIAEDSGKQGINDFLKIDYPDLDIMIVYNPINLGHACNVDVAYSYADTEYIFQCEEDWLFYNSGYIEESLNVIDADSKIKLMWLRSDIDTNGHPICKPVYQRNGSMFRIMSRDYNRVWSGFTWNPCLIKKETYKSFGNYQQYKNEAGVSVRFKELGYVAAKCINPDGYVKHIGDHSSTMGHKW